MEEVVWLEGLVDNTSHNCGCNIQNIGVVGDDILFVKENAYKHVTV